MSHRVKCKRVHGHGKALTNPNTDSEKGKREFCLKSKMKILTKNAKE